MPKPMSKDQKIIELETRVARLEAIIGGVEMFENFRRQAHQAQETTHAR
jgi:hypothetical protein